MSGRFVLLLVFFCTVFGLLNTTAQTTVDVIYLKNGSIIKGKITATTTETTAIQTNDGREYVFKNNEIERQITNGTNVPTAIDNTDNKPLSNTQNTKKDHYSPAKTGYWNTTDFQLWGPISANTVNGYKLHQFGYVGIGIGLNSYTGLVLSPSISRDFTGMLMPIYLRYGGDILNKRVTPTYFVEGGYGFIVSDEPIIFTNNSYEKSTGGIYGGAGFGFKVRTNKNFSFGLSLAYKFQHTKSNNNYMTLDNFGLLVSNNETINYDLHRMGIKVIFIGFN
jgi:hypothetical protein